ncbi:hypothetical protein [Rhizobium giardinii]|uniref:hypothetical protein n=1 Tax=Rhizobium giardinii TaxID=56731 RepID=UPI0013AF745D
MPITIFSPAAMALLAINATTAAEAAMARRLEIRILVLSVGWRGVFFFFAAADMPAIVAAGVRGYSYALREKINRKAVVTS